MNAEASQTWRFATAALSEWASENAIVLLTLAVLLLLVQTARLAWVRSLGGRRIARHKALGAEGERRARALLEKRGYRILDTQKGGKYDLVIDEKPHTVHLRADYLVEKRGRTFVAEVKAGAESVKVTGRTTRRQLLEYVFAFDVSGVLLVDMVERRILEVKFPPLRGR